MSDFEIFFSVALFALYLWLEKERLNVAPVCLALLSLYLLNILSADFESFAKKTVWLFNLSTVVALIHSWKSPNYRFLFLGVLAVGIIDLATHDFLLSFGAFYYLAISLMDFVIIRIISHRAPIARWLSSKNYPVISKLSKECLESFGFSRQEAILVLVYMASITVNIFSFVEKSIRDYTAYEPDFIYNIYSPLKIFLSLLLLTVMFAIAYGGARGIYDSKKII